MAVAYLETSAGAFERWNGQRIAGVAYPAGILSKWSAEALADLGLYIPLAADPIPAGMVSRGQSVALVDGAVRYVHDLAPAPAPTEQDVRREGARRLAALAAEYSEEERQTWATQVAEAEALQADPEALAPMLRQLAAADGADPALFGAGVLAKRDALAAAGGQILACQRALIASDPIPADYRDESHWL